YHLYTLHEIVNAAFAYIICGLRFTPSVAPAHDGVSPLQRWLLSPPTTRCPLATYVAVLTKRFLRDLLRDWWRDRVNIQAYCQWMHLRPDRRQTILMEVESRARTRALREVSSPVEESIMFCCLGHGWLH